MNFEVKLMKNIKLFLIIHIILLLPGLVASNILASTVYSTFGPGDTYADSGQAVFHTAKIAVPFIPTNDYFLDSIELVAHAFQSETNTLNVNLVNDAGGLPNESSVIETLAFSNFPLGTETILLINSELKPLLSSGVQYWLVYSPASSPLTGFALYFNVLDIRGVARQLYTGDWEYNEDRLAPTFRVNGVDVSTAQTYSYTFSGVFDFASPTNGPFLAGDTFAGHVTYYQTEVGFGCGEQCIELKEFEVIINNETIINLNNFNYLDPDPFLNMSSPETLQIQTYGNGSFSNTPIMWVVLMWDNYNNLSEFRMAFSDWSDYVHGIITGGTIMEYPANSYWDRGLDNLPDQIIDLINDIDEAVSDGDLVSEGIGMSQNDKIKILKNMIQDLIDVDLELDTCEQLSEIYKKIDGKSSPPDFVSGPATSNIRIAIEMMLVEHCGELTTNEECYAAGQCLSGECLIPENKNHGTCQ